MGTMWRRFWGSIANRIFLLLVFGITAAVLLTLWLGIRQERRDFMQMRTQHMADRVVQLLKLLDAVPADSRSKVLAVELGPGLGVEPNASAPLQGEPDESVQFMLAARLRGTATVLGVRNQAMCTNESPPEVEPERRMRPGPCHVIDLRLADGTPLRLTAAEPGRMMPRPPGPGGPGGPGPGPRPPAPLDFSLQIGVFLLCVAALAYLAARMTVKPLRQLAKLAGQFGDNMDKAPLPEQGPIEVRKATAALNAMQAKIQQHIEQRVYILAAIAHDLQTPLTRLRLRLEKVEDIDLRKRLIDDLAATQILIKEGLDYARSSGGAAEKRQIDFDSLLASVCAEASDAGQHVEYDNVPTGVAVIGHPGMLYRCLMNLVENAVKYGDFARVSAHADAGAVTIHIRDGGPGVPEGEIDRVFQPFYRLETSRSRETGGAGLGLAIARNIAERHGGKVWLENTAMGAMAVLVLPLVQTDSRTDSSVESQAESAGPDQ